MTSLMQRVMDDGHDEFEDVGRWSSDNSHHLAAPLGPTGARKIQQLVFGADGTAHHALLIGRTGSGKSNLLHVLIVSLAEIYSPEQLEVFLVDFKKGVEFKDYAVHKLPHARVVAIESELEFGAQRPTGHGYRVDKKRGRLSRCRSAGDCFLSGENGQNDAAYAPDCG